MTIQEIIHQETTLQDTTNLAMATINRYTNRRYIAGATYPGGTGDRGDTGAGGLGDLAGIEADAMVDAL